MGEAKTQLAMEGFIAEPGLPRLLEGKRGVSVVAATAFLISFVASWVPSIWTDEGATVAAASRSLPDLYRLVQGIDAVHASYYALMHLWFTLVDVSAMTLRLPSAVAVGVTAGLLVKLVSQLQSARLGIVVGFVFAVLPRTTWMGAEGRSSAVSTLVAVAVTLVLVSWVRNRSTVRLGAYALLVAAGIWLHIDFVFLLPAHLVLVVALGVRSQRLVAWFAAGGIACAVALPVVALASSQAAQIGGGLAFEPARWARQLLINQVYLGETPGPAAIGGIGSYWLLASLATSVVGWLLTAVGLWALLRRSADAAPALGLLAITWLMAPSILVACWSLISGSNMYNPRYFAFCAPAAAILVGAGLSALRRVWLQVGLAVVLIVCLLPIYVSQRTANGKQGADWSQVASHIASGKERGEGVYFSPRPTTRTISIAYPRSFEGLVDITLLRAGPADGSLAGESKPLETALSEDAPATIWAVWKIDSPTEMGDLARFRQAGYEPVATWTGTADRVVELRR